MYQINDDMPLGCIYESEDGSTKYCPMCNHDDVPYCQWFEDEPEAAIGIDERPVYCPILPSAQPEQCEYYAICRHGSDESKLRARLKICEYCNEDSEGYVTPIEKNNHAFVRFGMNGWELDLKANGWHGSAKIRYCPMCGRDLLVK